MGILAIIFFLCSFLPLVQAGKENNCPTSFCGNFSLDYPFKLQNLQPPNNCPYINLTCNKTLSTIETLIANLSYGGDFYVRYVGHYDSYIQLYDPGNCLMRRLMGNLNLSSSPFKAISYQNYTFYVCPSDADIIGHYVFPIGCLSNSTNSTVATALVKSHYMLKSACKVIGRWPLPVLEPYQFEFDGINGDLYLTWNATSCKACGDTDVDTGGSKGILWSNIAGSPFFVPFFAAVALFFLICFLQIMKMITGRNERNSASPTTDAQPESAAAARGPQLSTAEGLDESKISSCTELVVFSESRRNPGGPDSNTCSICLESYLPQDFVRSILRCDHGFHAECIELWLRQNRTCPVCRTIL